MTTTPNPAPAKLTVGQTLWRVPSPQYGKPGNATVTKVGRQYATVSIGDGDDWRRAEQIDMATMREKKTPNGNNNYLSSYYVSRVAYETETANDEAWSFFCATIHDHRYWLRPVLATVETIAQARKLLGIAQPASEAKGETKHVE